MQTGRTGEHAGALAARAAAIAALTLAALPIAAADEPPVPAAAQARVFVSGVPGGFEAIRAAVDRARLATGREYRIVIVDSAGSAGEFLSRGLRADRQDRCDVCGQRRVLAVA